MPDRVDPDKWLEFYHGRYFKRRVNSNGSIKIDNRAYYVKRACAGEYVSIRLNAHSKEFEIVYKGKLIKTCEIKGLHHGEVEFIAYVDMMLKEAESMEKRRLWRARWQKKAS